MADSNSPEPHTPLSPCSHATFSGDTIADDHADVHGDIESQSSSRTRSSVFGRLCQVITARFDWVPDHWKPGNINQRRQYLQLSQYPDGLPQFAAFMNCDENFLLTRRYGWLHTRVMMFHQSELHILENRLRSVDRKSEIEDPDALIDHKSFVRGEEGERRRALMKEIDKKLEEYDACVMRAKDMASLPKAPRRDCNSVRNFLSQEGQVAETERNVYMNDLDCASLVEQGENKTMDGYVEDILGMLPCDRLTKFLFSTPEQRHISEGKGILLFDKHRIDILIRLIITVLAVGLLLAPVVVLFRKQDSGTVKIMVILVFTLGFSLALSMATKAKRAEVFAATAAYCAVLVVFLGNFVPPSSAVVSS